MGTFHLPVSSVAEGYSSEALPAPSASFTTAVACSAGFDQGTNYPHQPPSYGPLNWSFLLIELPGPSPCPSTGFAIPTRDEDEAIRQPAS
jgi:hypothetical protein